jgi:hypothetical protein
MAVKMSFRDPVGERSVDRVFEEEWVVSRRNGLPLSVGASCVLMPVVLPVDASSAGARRLSCTP